MKKTASPSWSCSVEFPDGTFCGAPTNDPNRPCRGCIEKIREARARQERRKRRGESVASGLVALLLGGVILGGYWLYTKLS